MPGLIMRKFLPLLLLTSLCCQYVFARSTPQKGYSSFTGTIGKTVITMHLHYLNKEYYGYYYYERTRQPIFFSGDDTTAQTGKIRLTAYLPGNTDIHETFTLTPAGQELKGEWLQDDKSKPLPVLLRENRNAISFTLAYTAGERKLRPAHPESPSASYFASTIWPVENKNVTIPLRRVITGIFGSKDNDDIENVLEAEKTRLPDEYTEENNDLDDSLFAASVTAYNLFEERKLLVAFESPKLLTLASQYYTYSGGAHGNYGTTFISIDLATYEELKLTDVFSPAGIKKLQAELEKEFRLQAGIKPGESLTDAGLFENKIEPNDNFYLTSKGIGFSYMPYEIGPYAMGEVNLFIPFSRLMAHLQPAAKKWVAP